MIRRVFCLAAGILLIGCTSAPWRPMADWVRARELLDQADRLARAGDDAGARAMYGRVVQEHPRTQWAATALFRMARLEATGESPIRNYRQAYGHFDQLVREYPKSPYADDALAWRKTLAHLLALEEEVARSREDLSRLESLKEEVARSRQDLWQLKSLEEEVARSRQGLQRLKRLEEEVARSRQSLERLKKLEQEAARTRQDLERLKKIDMELESRRP